MPINPSPASAFSPSKQRTAASQAKDWNYVDSWLQARYAPRSAPPFERSAETLKVLLALAACNEAVDEEAELLANVEGQALTSLKADVAADRDKEVLGEVEAALTPSGKEALDAITESTITLGVAVPEVGKIGGRIVELATSQYDLEQQCQRIDIAQRALDDRLKELQKDLRTLQGNESYKIPDNLPSKVSEWNRNTKQLARKVQEYQDRLASGEDGEGEVSVIDVVAEERSILDREARICRLENKVRSCQELPPDVDAAREEVEARRRELAALTKKRDRLFEGLVS